LNAEKIHFFYQTLLENEQFPLSRLQLDVFLERFDTINNLSRYNELIEYIKEKGATFFENIRTEVDENDVDDFMKVVSLQRHLNDVFEATTTSSFISNLSKPKTNSINKLNDNLFEVGPKIGQIKELAKRANQSSTNDYENIIEIIKRCKVSVRWNASNAAFECQVGYSKNGNNLSYRFKEFEELYKKEQIMKDSETREDIEEEEESSNVETKLAKA
jgi:hypothetical protein